MRMLRMGICLLVAGLAAPAVAEVGTDGTAGPRVRLSGDFEVGPGLGTKAGHNLFHSFEKFSLANGERATFSGPDDIRNVISRVTGGERSEIDGTIRSTIPGADFYFINPAGVVFGPNASLDLQGSFYVSTADELRFADDAVFSATDPAASSFTMAPPEAFGFLGAAPGSIAIEESFLEVPSGETLSLVGGDIDITGGPAGYIIAEAGQITLAAVGGPGQARLDSGDVMAERAAGIRLTDQAVVDASGDGGGAIRIRGGRLVVEERSFVFADNTGPTDATAGLDVQAETVRIGGESELTADVFGSGSGGGVSITAGNLEIRAGAAVTGSTFAEGNAGTVTIEAGKVVLDGAGIHDFTGIASRAKAGNGDAGKVTVKAGELVIDGGGREDGALISAATLAAGNAGSVEVTATTLTIRGGGGIGSSTFGDGDAARSRSRPAS
jgi:filamentous hemagglutinin family protein